MPPATGRGRHHRSAVNVPGPHDPVVRRLAPGAPFGEDFKLSAEMMKTIPPEEIGRMMSGVEAAELILRQARQAKMLTKDEEHRAVTNIAKLRQLRGRRDGDT